MTPLPSHALDAPTYAISPPSNMLAVNEAYRTIQGEGMMSGTPAVFVRFQGCAVGCPFCDTKQTWELAERHRVASLADANRDPAAWCLAAPESLVADVARMTSADDATIKWVVLTGGEPLAQPFDALDRFIDGLQGQYGLLVQVETSGTEPIEGEAIDEESGVRFRRMLDINWLTVSPKDDMPGGKLLDRDTCTFAQEIKFVVGRPSDVERARALLASPLMAGRPGFRPLNRVISVQPIAPPDGREATRKAIDLAIAACYRYGWRLSVQTHKALGLP
jgi:7-carboxy-7-deazaguanine synthase